MTAQVSALLFALLCVVVALFQACLAAGLPWGAASMGGRFPGKYPPKMRVAAVINVLLLAAMTVTVLVRAGIVFPALVPFSRIAVWGVVGGCLIGTILNTLTPSAIERRWAPVALFLLITSAVVALS